MIADEIRIVERAAEIVAREKARTRQVVREARRDVCGDPIKRLAKLTVAEDALRDLALAS
jgi:hypothetical protein